MAFQGVITRPDGSLYCDVSVESLGFPQYTTLMNLPIRYDEGKFKEVGEKFVAMARTTCPVDTGYLRDHNDYASDAGGVEMWSEAFYSAYQEYGTSRCRAQPWFEASIQTALAESNIEDTFATLETRYAYVDSLLNELYTMTFITKADAYYGLELCQKLRQEFGLLGIDDKDGGPFDQITKQIADRIVIIEEQERQMASQEPLGFLAQMIIALIVGMISALIRSFLDNLLGDLRKADANPHNPTH